MSNEDIVKLIQAGTDVQYNSERLYIPVSYTHLTLPTTSRV